MLKNYIKVAWRNLSGNLLYSIINILGLSVGLVCTILISFYVLHEFSYDKFFTDSDRIYRISRDYYPVESSFDGFYPASLNAPFAPQLKADFPQIEESARLFHETAPIVWRDNEPIWEKDFAYVDQSFLSIFDFSWVLGRADDALKEPFSIVLTDTLARKYFPNSNPLGASIPYGDGNVSLKVTGVIRDLPDNTHLPIRAFMSMNTVTSMVGDVFLQNWRNNTDFHSYIKLRPGAGIADLESEFPDFVDRYVDENASETSGLTAMKLTDIHLRSQRVEEIKAPGSYSNVLAFAFIAVCILLIASINYMNLSTARSSKRSLEVGVRKVNGAAKNQLIRQFLGESVLFAVIAQLIAVVMVDLLLRPWFENFIGISFDFSVRQSALIAVSVTGLVFVVGLAAGSYPAFFLASFKPAQVLKGAIFQGSGGKFLRQGLVILQFSISIALVVASAVMYMQMNYARSIELGLDKDRVIISSGTMRTGLGDQWQTMKNELLSHPEITHVTRSHYTPFIHDQNSLTVSFTKNSSSEAKDVKYMSIDFDFFETYGIDIIAGRDFSEERGTDAIKEPSEQDSTTTSNFIINAKLARDLGWTPDEAIGQYLWLGRENELRFQVIGVVEDSHFESLITPIKPLMFFIAPWFRPLPHGAIRVTGNNLPQTLSHIDAVWKKFLPELPVNRNFLDEDFNALYETELKQGAMLNYFTVLAIFVACLGLYGLASFNAERRTKEIGVRKVMGGSVWSIVVLLTNGFSKLVLIANLIAWPAAYFAMNRWLAYFAYRIDLTPVIFIGSGLIALCIAWVTVGGTTAKAASRKPVLALRYE